MKPNEQRAKTAIVLIWIVLFFEILSLSVSLYSNHILTTVQGASILENDDVQMYSLIEGGVALFYLIAYIASMVVFIRWFRRAYYNLHQIAEYLQYSEGWAAGCWFVPIINLFRPLQIMRELYEVSINLLKNKGMDVDENKGTTSLGWWWALWILNNIIGQIAFRYSNSALVLDELMTSNYINIANNLVGIPLALITIKVIKEYAKLEPFLINLEERQDLTHHIVE
ncbi:MAG: DUF4328 domain-containing protein [bacterium]|nr:DUF4328 domain-containing protein [bacterium]